MRNNLTPSEIREWMDKQIQARKLMNEKLIVEEHEYSNDELKNFSASDDIHIGAEAVRYIAEVLKLPLCATKRPRDSENPYEIFIIYEQEVFFGIETEDEYRERGAVV